jgi:signal transduction histidine kinase
VNPVPPPGDAGTLVVRDGIVVYASEGVAALAGRAVGEIVGRPFADLAVEEARATVVARREQRLRGEPVPKAYELVLALPGGGRRIVDVHVDVDGVDLLVHLRDAAARQVRRLRLEAVATLGGALQRERGEPAIHARVREGLAELGLSSALLRVEPGGLRVVWAELPPELARGFRERTGRSIEGYVGPLGALSAKIFAEGVAFIDDWGPELARFVPHGIAEWMRAAVVDTGLSRSVAVRLGAADDPGLPLAIVVAGEWLRSDDTPALRLFAAQLAAALEAARTISDLSRRNADLAALDRIAGLAGEATDLDAFFAGASEVLRSAVACTGTAVFVLDEAGETLVRAHGDGLPPEVAARTARIPCSGRLAELLRERAGRVVTSGEDAPMAPLGLRTVLWVPLVVRSRAVGALAAGFDAPGDEVRERADLLIGVGAHLAAAIESHGLLADLRRRVDELTLLNDVALASARPDPVALLEPALRRVCETLGADVGAAYVREGEQLLLATAAGVSPACAASISELRVGEGGAGLAVLRRRPVLGASMEAYGGRCARVGACADVQGTLSVPLLAKSHAVGAILLGRRAQRGFSAGEVRLLSAIGVQLGIGLENARLYADARRRVDDLSLLDEVGRTIAGSLDLDHVLRNGADAARRLAGASRGFVLLHDALAGEVRFGGGAGVAPGELAHLRARVEDVPLAAEVIRERRPLVVDDAQASPRSRDLLPPGLAGRSLLAAPVLLRGEPLGVLVVDEVGGRRAFGAADVERVTAVANQLAVAIENARLYSETRRRAEELGLLHEVGRSLVATLEIERVLEAGVRNLARIVEASDAYLMLTSADGKELEIAAVAGEHPELLGRRLSLQPPGGNLASLAIHRREPLIVEDALASPMVDQDLRSLSGGRGVVAVPLVVRDRAIGAIVITDPRGPRLFTPAEVERAASIANQLAAAVENARLYEDLRRSYAELERAQQQIIQGERLAALGELSAVVAHEVRNPLGVIFNSLGSLRRLLRPTGDAKLLLDIVGEEADRLNRIVGDLLDFARPSTPELRPEPFQRVVEEAIAAALAQRPAGLQLERELDPGVPQVPMDARLVRQAIVNVAVNAVQAMPRGGRLTVRTRREIDAAVLEIEDTGAGIPDEVRNRMFEPFFTTKASGTGLGLAVVKRIVDGHGGSVTVRSRPGAGTAFALRFPLEAPPS